MKQLSIIVPIYNTEKYLRKCVDSLLEQDLDDYEILLINDSSPDSSIDIMKEYEEKFPNIIRIFSKENGGLGDTRNFGIPYAKGKYVTFVDSDDYIKENSLNRLCTKMDNEDLDILVYDFVKEYDNVDFIHEQAMEIIDDKHYVLSTPNACNKMFKTSIFQENGVRFPTKIWYEDLAVIPGLVKYTKKIGGYSEFINSLGAEDLEKAQENFQKLQNNIETAGNNVAGSIKTFEDKIANAISGKEA